MGLPTRGLGPQSNMVVQGMGQRGPILDAIYGRVKVWMGAAWLPKYVRVWNGSTWKLAAVRWGTSTFWKITNY